MKEQIILVTDVDNSVRIDKYLSDNTDFTRNKIQKLIDDNNILVNGKKIKNSFKVSYNDEIRIIDEEKPIKIEAENIPIDIIYEDDDVIVVNKESGMVVHPAPGNYSKTLVNALMFKSKNLSSLNGEFRPGIVHRIDKDTSGLLIVAKNDKAHAFLADELKDKKIKRKYIALVDGIINHDTGTIDAPIGRDEIDRKKMKVTNINSKSAITNFRVIERYKRATLIECLLDTGRTHQIRVHMKYINHPVINDPTYGKQLYGDFGQMLHAKEIEFIHPTTKEKMHFECDVPQKFIEILDKYKEE